MTRSFKQGHSWQSSQTPAGGTNGLEAVTGQDVRKLVEAMTGPGNPFTILPFDTVIDGADGARYGVCWCGGDCGQYSSF